MVSYDMIDLSLCVLDSRLCCAFAWDWPPVYTKALCKSRKPMQSRCAIGMRYSDTCMYVVDNHTRSWQGVPETRQAAHTAHMNLVPPYISISTSAAVVLNSCGTDLNEHTFAYYRRRSRLTRRNRQKPRTHTYTRT